ncbi:uncharacterized protein LOC128671235 [Plodia interpunctella]|uniref:uncharacterized protein LOC128671235 n=1 Tax=Plodia interpunctella TaxID=58824 RepID=UPI002367F514|nr:uncharacterized protein LOC128671235 [Plodia interpunctella]
MNMESSSERKNINKAKSYSIQSPPQNKIKSEPVKRKSFYVNDAVKSLDLALGRLKKSKLVNGEESEMQIDPVTSNRNMYLDSCPSFNGAHRNDNISLMSMNFSHYELMRNLSRTNCNSDGAHSGSTCNANSTPDDLQLKDEHLERYFRSAEMWNTNFREVHPHVHFQLPEK